MTDQILVDNYRTVDLTRQALLRRDGSLSQHDAITLLADADAILLNFSNCCPNMCHMLQGYLSMDAAVYWYRQGEKETAKDYAERSSTNFEAFEMRRPHLEHELNQLNVLAPEFVSGLAQSEAITQDKISEARSIMDGFIGEISKREFKCFSIR